MDSSRIVYLFIIHLAILIHLDTVALAQPELIFHICSDSGNYSLNSSYKKNLNNLLSSFNTMQPNNGFFNGSVGQNTDKVNAVALCRGDVLPQECNTCVNASSYELTEVCPNQKEAIGWYDLCMLRYSNDSILGIVSGVTDYMWNKENVSNVVEFNKVLLDLLTKLKTQAASGGSLRKFATGDASYANNFGRVYALVQCTPDLSQLQCNNCLGDSFLFIPKYLDGLEEARVFGASCYFRYDNSLFYNSTSVDAPPPTTTTTATKGKDSNASKLVVIIVVPTVSSLILIVCVFFFVRKKKKRDIAETVDDDDITMVESLQFNFDTIRVATDNFSDTNKLGQGGFGAVYKGTLHNGEDIAAKRLSVDSGQGDHEFKNEVLLVAKLQHRNLVRLRGFCLEGNERLLVYEFVPNTSLDHFIFGNSKAHCRRKFLIK